MALIIGAVRAERFCDGALLDFLDTGCILKWLQRLEEIDEPLWNLFPQANKISRHMQRYINTGQSLIGSMPVRLSIDMLPKVRLSLHYSQHMLH